jgi:hypothetical protein
MSRPPVSVEGFEILGVHPVRSDRVDGFDGFDAALTLSTGEVVLYGVRTAELVLSGEPARTRGWRADYAPIRIEFDLSATRFWDFDAPMWIGPEPRPCLVWSNAEFFTPAGISYLIRAGDFVKTLSGRDGHGLPLRDQLALLR